MAYRQRNRRTKSTPAERIQNAHLALLQDKLPGPDANKFTIHNLSLEKARTLWAEHGDEVMQEWLLIKPRTRPLAWWLFSCPAEPPFKLPSHPDEWARWPDLTPAQEIQAKFLCRHGL